MNFETPEVIEKKPTARIEAPPFHHTPMYPTDVKQKPHIHPEIPDSS